MCSDLTLSPSFKVKVIQGQTRVAKCKSAYNWLLLVLEVFNVKPIYRIHALGIFGCVQM